VGDWNHLTIIHTVPEQRTRKARNLGTTENRHILHCTRAAGSADIKVRNIFHVRNNNTCSTKFGYREAATLCTR